MQPKFTPGPWTVKEWTRRDIDVLGFGARVASVAAWADPAQTMADAHLIVSAPDLYDAARLTLMFHAAGPWNSERAAEWKRVTGHEDATTKILCDFIRAALRKADGDAP